MSQAPLLLHTPCISPAPAVVAVFLVVLSLVMPPSALIDPSTTLGCHVRSYRFRYTKPPIYDSDGTLLTCTGFVTVNSCWGRCDSSEFGDYVMPYKVSNHPVCSYTGRSRRRALLTECEGYPDPTVEVFDATGCECKLCNSDYMSCENLNG
ncbi:thyrostimulin beta-5 subunit-like [Physella acuta]|uniref:thyrostimulin beta-5 subunit-like n=1 Tax=Physella acuta TaxID=109671 RepID=UPI0027DDD828|nr:thyrostimulin beta-5 subunit-like [Physella acuta]